MRTYRLLFFSTLLFVFAACQSDESNEGTANASNENIFLESATGFSIVKGPESSSLNGSGIRNMEYMNGQFNFSLNGFELGVPTAGSENRVQNPLNQHIQPFVTSIPGTPKNTSTFGIRLPNTTMIVGALLVQSDNFSVKDNRAGSIKRLTFQDGNTVKEEAITNATVLLNKPNGVYRGEEAANIPLDFFLFNFQPGEDRKIEVTLNGETALLDIWQNYIIKGLTPGSHKIGLKLVDGAGHIVEAGGLPFVEREFRVE